MSIYFGNLSITDLERRTGWSFTEAERIWLDAHRQDSASIRLDEDYFHIFDIPFCIITSPKAQDYLVDLLVEKNKESISKEPLRILLAGETEWEKEDRKRREEREEMERDPNQRWMKKWHLKVPINDDMDYLCFFNTIHTGYENIPSDINGSFWIERDADGLHGYAELDWNIRQGWEKAQ